MAGVRRSRIFAALFVLGACSSPPHHFPAREERIDFVALSGSSDGFADVRAEKVSQCVKAPASEANRTEAEQRAKRAVELIQDDDYKLALIEWERACQLSDDPNFLYSIGYVYFRLGNEAQSLPYFRAYLEREGSRVTADRRMEVEGMVGSFEQNTGWIAIRCDTGGPNDPAGRVELSLDDEPIGRCPVRERVRVNRGSHVLAALGDHASAKREITISGREIAGFAVTGSTAFGR